LNELALFAGAGGGILGGRLLGWRTVCAVEVNEYCQRVLMQRQDDGILDPFPIWPDVRTFDGKPWAGCVDIVTGGFPCQDISAAGKGAGIDGERSGLWREMARIIGEVRPRYVLVENSPMLAVRGLGTVLGDLSALGFDAEWGVVSAGNAGAPHERERIWIVAYTELPERWPERKARHGLEIKPNGVFGQWQEGPGGARGFREALANGRGMDDGVASRMDRLRAIGNGQVPAVVRTVWGLLSDF
jgi:DNA (cytosine-5)-methyltransferase 1